jgi:lichenan operon transcriptional antiterminator
MREVILINILLNEKVPVRRAQIAKVMNLSESTIRDLINEINRNRDRYGLEVLLIKGSGYVVKVTDQLLMERFLGENPEEVDVYNQEQRRDMMLFYILQANGYITIGSLMERMQISRSTIAREMDEVVKALREQNLTLVRKAHHGLVVESSEQDFRKAFSKYVLNSSLYLEPAKNYKAFLDTIRAGELEDMLSKALEGTSLKLSDVASENILTHIKIVMFRVSEKNFIANEKFLNVRLDDIYFKVAYKISRLLSERFGIELPEDEVSYLAAHISTRTNVTELDEKEREELQKTLKGILEDLDVEFKTEFGEDNDLIEALLLHLYPLLKRLYFNLQLENPLIEEIYVSYTNVFVVSYTFAEHIRKRYGFGLTRDEIGYIALHFAAHFERASNRHMEKIKRIVVICATGGGSANLIRLKLESIFPKANIVTTSQFNMDQFENELPDLFLTTIPMKSEHLGVPMLHIKQFLDDAEVKRIKEITALHVSNKPIGSPELIGIRSLFSKDLFSRTGNKDYLGIIKRQAELMIGKGYTTEDFTYLVLERENKMPTIYRSGIAGPHPMKLNGKVDSIGVTILDSPIEWNGRTVHIIFLINLIQGHLFVHKEISHLLLYYIENQDARERLLKCQTYEEFIIEIEKTIK